MVQIKHVPSAFSTTINLFVTVSVSESKSPLDIKFNNFLQPARSFSDSPDIFNGNQQTTVASFQPFASSSQNLRTGTSMSQESSEQKKKKATLLQDVVGAATE